MKRKAISPLIAILMLILLAVVGGVLIFGGMTGFIGGQIKSVSITAEATILGDYAVVKVKNTGNQPVTITKIGVNKETYWENIWNGSQLLKPGDTFSPSKASSWEVGRTYTFNVTYTAQGVGDQLIYLKATAY